MDCLCIDSLEVWTHIGVPDDERKKEQRLLISVELCTDLRPTGVSDDVKQSINYWDVSQRIKELAKIERKTIERFAEDVATMILSEFKQHSVKVSVTKFALPDAKSVSAIIERRV